MLHNTRVAIRFRAKNPHHRLPEILRWYACGAEGRSGGRLVYGHVIAKFSRMGSLPHFLTHGAPLSIFHPLVIEIHPFAASNMPRLETVENCMLVSQMMVQGMWNSKSPLLQLPYVEMNTLRHFKKVLGLMLLSFFCQFDVQVLELWKECLPSIKQQPLACDISFHFF